MNARVEYEPRPLMRLHKRGLRGALVLLLLLPVAAWAGGVVTNCTEADLRAAMAGGGVVTFACDGTILLANTITNEGDITLDGSGHQVTISGGNAARIFYVATNVQFTAVNLTLANGFATAGAAILNSGGRANLSGVTFLANVASDAAPDDGGRPGARVGRSAIWAGWSRPPTARSTATRR